MSHEIVDHFAGAGGWDVGARDLGVEAYGVELMTEAIATRDANSLRTVGFDVWKMESHLHETDTFVSSPPCQAYSIAGKGAGRRALDEVLSVLASDLVLHPEALRAEALRWGDERIGLVLTPVTYALRYRPQYIALEQVPSVGPVWRAMADRLTAAGYRCWTGPLHAEQYGVPQTRTRAVLIARRDGVQPTMPTPTHSRYYPSNPTKLDDGVPKWVSMADALGRGMLARPSMTVTGGGTYTGGAEPFGNGARQGMQREIDTGRWLFNDQTGTAFDPEWPDKRPATTVAGRGLVQNPGATANRHNGATKSRNDGVRITAAEASTLQTFPADFTWVGGSNRQYQMIGNAVPPLLARAILTELWRSE